METRAETRDVGATRLPIPVIVAFATFGVFAGAFAIAAVDIERSFHLSDAALGSTLAAGVVVGAAVNALGGALIDRWGAGAALARSLVVWGLFLVGQAVAPNFGTFAVVFTLAVAAGGLVDVVMNVVAATALAAQPGRLVRFHGLFNAGCVVGAAITAAALHAGASWRVVWAGVAVVGIGLGVVTRGHEIPTPPPSDHPSILRALAGLRHEGLVVLALVFAAAAMVEGGVATWGVLYLRKDLGVGVLAGMAAYVAGEGLAAITRASIGPTLERVGIRRGIAIGGAIAAAGVAMEAASHVVAIAAIGLAAAHVGITVVWPLLVAETNKEARHPALAIGGVTAAGYLGMVAGPPIVGLLSSLVSLRVGLLALVGAGVFVAVTPPHVRRVDAGADSRPTR